MTTSTSKYLPSDLQSMVANSPVAAALLANFDAIVEANLSWLRMRWESMAARRPHAEQDVAEFQRTTRHGAYTDEYAQEREDYQLCAVVANHVSSTYGLDPRSTFRYSAEKALACAVETARRDCTAWVRKMERKLAGATSVVRDGNNWATFTLFAMVSGVQVRVDQQVVVKYAPRTHRMFNQFPARLYVAGKFTPEAKLAAAVAAHPAYKA